MMDRLEAKELVKKYPICLIYKENGEDVQFNLFEYVIETDKKIERLLKDLQKYGKHHHSCRLIIGGSAYERCTCGFNQALEEK